MRGRLSIRWIWHNVYPADYHYFIGRGILCNACKTKHCLDIPRLQWGSNEFQTIKMDDPEYRAKINGQLYTFEQFKQYTIENGQVGDITIRNAGPHLTLDNGHHRMYIAWLLGETYVRVVIAGYDNVIPTEAFEPNSINSPYLYA